MRQHGFTLIEVLISVFIIIMVTTIITVSLSRYTRTQSLNGATRLVVSEIEDARSRTLSSQGSSQYGVFFDDNRVVLFQGDSYDSGAATNEETVLDTRVEITDVTLTGGGSAMIFERLSGETTHNGTIEIALTSDALIMRTITVQKTGLVSYE